MILKTEFFSNCRIYIDVNELSWFKKLLKRGVRLHKKTKYVCITEVILWILQVLNKCSLEWCCCIIKCRTLVKGDYLQLNFSIYCDCKYIFWILFFGCKYIQVLYVSKYYSIWERITHLTVLEGYFETLNEGLGFDLSEECVLY